MPTQNRSFGSVRRLPSKRWQARYSTPDRTRYTAPHTFDTKRAANDWLADARTKMLRGSWVDPTASATTFGTYADDWLSTRTLAPRTRDLYRYQLDRWADTPIPAPGGGTVHLYALEMGHLTLPAIRRWYGAVLAAAAASASTAGPRDRRNPARVWADSDPGRAALAAAQIPPPRPTGRLSPAALDSLAVPLDVGPGPARDALAAAGIAAGQPRVDDAQRWRRRRASLAKGQIRAQTAQ